MQWNRQTNVSWRTAWNAIYSTVGVSLRPWQRALTSAFPCSAAGRQLLTSSAGIIEIQPGYDVIEHGYALVVAIIPAAYDQVCKFFQAKTG